MDFDIRGRSGPHRHVSAAVDFHFSCIRSGTRQVECRALVDCHVGHACIAYGCVVAADYNVRRTCTVVQNERHTIHSGVVQHCAGRKLQCSIISVDIAVIASTRIKISAVSQTAYIAAGIISAPAVESVKVHSGGRGQQRESVSSTCVGYDSSDFHIDIGGDSAVNAHVSAGVEVDIRCRTGADGHASARMNDCVLRRAGRNHKISRGIYGGVHPRSTIDIHPAIIVNDGCACYAAGGNVHTVVRKRDAAGNLSG